MKHIFIGIFVFHVSCLFADKLEKNGALLDKNCSFFGTKCAGCKTNFQILYNEPGYNGLWIQIRAGDVSRNAPLEQKLKGRSEVVFTEPFLLSEEDRRTLKLPRHVNPKTGTFPVIFRNQSYYIQLSSM